MLQISVILCTHNPRVEYLQRVLESLRTQTLPRELWELLLIDNASKSPVSAHFDLSWHTHARHVHEEELGLTAARLRGIREAQADVLVFVDDDTVLAPDYLEQALRVGVEWPFVGVWGGSPMPEYEKPLPHWVGDQVWRLTVMEVTADVWSNLREGFATVPVGAGLCVRKSIGHHFLERCKNNKSSLTLGRKGSGLGAYEDVEIAHCAIDLGLGTGKSTRLRLTHLIPEARLTLDYFVRHAEGDAASLMVFRASRGLPIREPRPPTLVASVRWFFHRLIHQVSREQYEIDKAHQRGLIKGYHLARQFLDTVK
jgi:glycosyltransferase involved in cell wall biosynthesis